MRSPGFDYEHLSGHAFTVLHWLASFGPNTTYHPTIAAPGQGYSVLIAQIVFAAAVHRLNVMCVPRDLVCFIRRDDGVFFRRC